MSAAIRHGPRHASLKGLPLQKLLSPALPLDRECCGVQEFGCALWLPSEMVTLGYELHRGILLT